ncbi:histidine phosphatase family protein [Rhodococcus sp. NPDC059968]|uniref:histidine phosphatase family protein n=1 Tax=Rhodococcus sp. NPDC059968 TaxID=3347017 RepID=UPI00366D15F6
MVVMVRHADAVATSAWPGLDADRPLSTLGDRQSVHLVAALAHVGLSALHSSPTLRCRRTLQSLSVARRPPIVDDPLLAANASGRRTRCRVRPIGRGTLWCTHREVFEQLAGIAAEQGASRSLPDGKDRQGRCVDRAPRPGSRYIAPTPPH